MAGTLAIPNPQSTIRLLETGQKALADARSVGEVKTIRDQAAAIAMYLRQQQLSEEAARDAAELKVRAERRLGEMIKPSRGNPDRVSGFAGLPEDVSHKQSSRWQRVASVPQRAFEKYVEQCREEKAEITTAAVMRLAPRQVKPKPPEPDDKEEEEEDEEEDASTARTAYFIRADQAIKFASDCQKLVPKFNVDQDAIDIARRAAAVWAEVVTLLESSS